VVTLTVVEASTTLRLHAVMWLLDRSHLKCLSIAIRQFFGFESIAGREDYRGDWWSLQAENFTIFYDVLNTMERFKV
jgi:hypothetical protein